MAGKAASNGSRRIVGLILQFGEYRVSSNENQLFVAVFFYMDSDVFSVGVRIIGSRLVQFVLEPEDFEGGNSTADAGDAEHSREEYRK